MCWFYRPHFSVVAFCIHLVCCSCLQVSSIQFDLVGHSFEMSIVFSKQLPTFDDIFTALAV